VAGKKVYIRSHTMFGQKSPIQEVFDIKDLVRLTNTSPDMVNWKCRSASRRFTLSRTDEIEKLVPYGLDTNVGGKTLNQTEQYERLLREKWSTKKRT
jgi:hypothetical protein